jgi:membrane-bound serine protease (ClpP class)
MIPTNGLALAALALALSAATAPAGGASARGAPAGGATAIRVEGELDLGDQALLTRAIAGAKGRDDKLVLELDTPGGEVQLAWTMARLLDEASKEGVPTVAWINDHALSAGALLALACDDVYMRGTASFGSAQAIQVGPTGIQGVSADEVVEEKLDSTWRASFRAFAQERGRSADLAEAMVDRDVTVRLVRIGPPDAGEERIVGDSEWNDLRQRGEEVKLLETLSSSDSLLNLTATEAVRLHMASGRADTLDEVLSQVGVPGAQVTRLETSSSEELAALLHRIAPMLLILGFVLAFVELKAPGFGVPGILSAACFGALLFGRYMVGLAEIVHVVLIAVGMVLLAVELFLVPGTIWVGLAGGIAILVGLAWSIADSGAGFEYEMDRRIALDGAFQAALWAAVALAVTFALSRLLPRTPLYGRLAVAPVEPRPARASAHPEAEGAHAAAARPGARGVALTDLRPVGKVALDDAPGLEYEGRSSGPEIARGTRVVVADAYSGRLVVEAAPGSSGAGDGGTLT